MPFMLSLAKSVLPKLVTGLFGSKKSSSTSSVDYVQLRKNAEKAGFNPLTALRNGGAAGFSTVTSPQLSSRDFIGEALGAGLDTAFNSEEIERDKERDRLEVDLMREQLSQMQSASEVVRSGDTFGYSIPSATTYTGVSNGGSSYRRSGVRTDGGSADVATISNRRDVGGPDLYVKNEAPAATAFGYNLQGSGRFSSGQTFEDAIGDNPLSWLAAPAIALDAIGYTWGRNIGERRMWKSIDRTLKASRRPPPYSPALNPPLRSNYGRPGSRSGF